MNKLQRTALFTSLLFAVVGLFTFGISSVQNAFAQDEFPPQEETLEATVTSVETDESFIYEGQEQFMQELTLIVTKGSLKGQTITVEGTGIPSSISRSHVPGDRVLVTYTTTPDGERFFFITDYIRRKELLYLFILFAFVVVAIGGLHGATSLVAMAVSFAIIFLFILPQIIAGNSPVVIALIGAGFIAPLTFYISHGWNTKTHIAIVATLITLTITGILATVVIDALRLTGFSTEEAGFLQNETRGLLNLKGILLAGIIIGVLGILDDITVTQTSIVEQIKRANPKAQIYALFTRSMKVGRDHIASLVNTLVLVYTGASLPLLLLFIDNPHPFGEVVNYEFIAEEIARILIGSIGLVLAVPIATYIASYIFSTSKQPTKS